MPPPQASPDGNSATSSSSSTAEDADYRIDLAEQLQQLRRHHELREMEHLRAKVSERWSNGLKREEARWIGITSGIYVGVLVALLAVILKIFLVK